MDMFEQALAEADRKLAEAEPELEALTKRVQALRQTQAALQSMVALDAPQNAAVSETLAASAIVPGVTMDMPNSTAEGVKSIMASHADQDVHLDDLRREYRERGWVDPSWPRPDATIYQALVRLTDANEHVIRKGRKVWRWHSIPPQPAEVHADLTSTNSEVFTS